MLQIYLLDPLGLGRTRSGAEKLVEQSAGHVAKTLHDLAASELSDEVLGELANIAALACEDVDGGSTADDVADLEQLVVVAVSSTGVSDFVSNLNPCR